MVDCCVFVGIVLLVRLLEAVAVLRCWRWCCCWRCSFCGIFVGTIFAVVGVGGGSNFLCFLVLDYIFNRCWCGFCFWWYSLRFFDSGGVLVGLFLDCGDSDSGVGILLVAMVFCYVWMIVVFLCLLIIP